LLFHLQLQSFIELIRHDKTQEALRYASEELAPRGAQNPEFLAELEKTMALLAFPELASFDRLQGDSADLSVCGTSSIRCRLSSTHRQTASSMVDLG
jgi:hypothetical protein